MKTWALVCRVHCHPLARNCLMYSGMAGPPCVWQFLSVDLARLDMAVSEIESDGPCDLGHDIASRNEMLQRRAGFWDAVVCLAVGCAVGESRARPTRRLLTD